MLIPSARDFSLKAHEGKVTSTVNGFKRSQAIHLQEVADLVWASGGTDEEIAAAWLHDAVEDTPVTREDILKHFGAEVAALVDGLTDPESFAAMPLAERKQSQAKRIQEKNKSVRHIKIADQISNVRILTLDRNIKRTHEECHAYIEGAKLIAAECHGASPLLDKLFSETYKKAAQEWGG